MGKYTPNVSKEIEAVLRDGSAVLGLKLCFRHIDLSLGLLPKWYFHVVTACMVHKNNPEEQPICARFAGEQTNHDLQNNSRGMIHRCPFGFTEICTPVMVDGQYAGPLFAGPCWLDSSNPPHSSLVIPKNKNWLEQRLTMLNCIATEISRILKTGLTNLPLQRRQQIMEYINETIYGRVSLKELSARLNLSPSRTTHLVRECFNTSLPLLSRQNKLRRAAMELTSTDQPIGIIAQRFGFLDQNYFSHVFSLYFGISPRKFRLKSRSNA